VGSNPTASAITTDIATDVNRVSCGICLFILFAV